ncbi:hypothetical protein [Pseudooceanicola sp.]|uniref:hypothetical protein n=1 Tax=Pseudooceanicola sp. TaxID=1914328 RepID=UPI00262EAD6E|nr:hypothetical protein [Pseudooceanicola sp.]MDF1855288.1 hypothetical protein [Pseudooceanicola sp.]
MSRDQEKRSAAPVGFVSELVEIEVAAVVYLQPCRDGPEAQAQVCTDLVPSLGPDLGRKRLPSFEDLSGLCARFGHRPLLRPEVAPMIASLAADFGPALNRMRPCAPGRIKVARTDHPKTTFH